MNFVIANAISGYLETLYNMNKKLIRICGVDIMNDTDLCETLVLDLIQDIPRVIPFSYNGNTKRIELDEKNGLLEFSSEIAYLMNDYCDVLEVNRDFLDNVRQIRNKYEHIMHGVKNVSSSSGSTELFQFTFDVKGNVISVTSNEFISTMSMLNILFDKIVGEVKHYAEIHSKSNYPYYKTISRHIFSDFNKIYKSDLLRVVGRISKNYRY